MAKLPISLPTRTIGSAELIRRAEQARRAAGFGPKLSGLEKVAVGAKGVSGAAGAAGAILPIFQKEDLRAHMDSLISEHPEVQRILERNPDYMEFLYKTLEEQYRKDKTYIKGGQLVDSWDRITSGLDMAAKAAGYLGAIPSGGTTAVVVEALSAAEEVVELAPKIPYAAYYAVKTGDYQAIPYWTAMEAASFIPVVGDLVDFKNIYLNRARKTFRKRTAASFLEKIAKGEVSSKEKTLKMPDRERKREAA